jgi:hypothetical protein
MIFRWLAAPRTPTDRRLHVARPARGAYNLCDVCTLRRHMLLIVVSKELGLLGVMTGDFGEGKGL